jgi:hypothetical protein
VADLLIAIAIASIVWGLVKEVRQQRREASGPLQAAFADDD